MQQRHDEHGVEAGNRRAGRRDFRDLLTCDAHHGEIAVGTAILLGHPELHQPHFAENLDDLLGETIGLVDLGRDRGHMPGDDFLHAVAKGDLLLGEAHDGAILLALLNGCTIIHPMIVRCRGFGICKPNQEEQDGRIDVNVMRALSLIFAAAFFSPTAAADNYPSRPIRLIVPYPAGGSTDIMARALQEPMARILGQPIIIDNRGGAAGTTGSNEAARADADGYTVLFANNGPISIAPLLQKGVDFDPLKSFATVSLVSTAPLVLVASEKVPVNDVAGLIAYARAQGKPMLYATAGPGSLGHLSTERLLNQAGLQMVHVPYRGQAPTTLAIFAGEVDILLTTASDTLNEHIRAGKVKLLGVSSPGASAVAPGAAAIGSALKGYSVETWFGILAPAGTPPEVVSKLNAALNTVLAMPQLRDRFLTFGVEAKASTPGELYARIAAEIPSWRKVIEERNVKVE